MEYAKKEKKYISQVMFRWLGDTIELLISSSILLVDALVAIRLRGRFRDPRRLFAWSRVCTPWWGMLIQVHLFEDLIDLTGLRVVVVVES